MNNSSLIGHVLQLLEHIDYDTLPPDRITSNFFRSKKYLGPKERRFIADTVFGIIRNRKYIQTLLTQFINEHPDIRGLEGPHIRYLTQFIIYINLFDVKFSFPLHFWKMHFPKLDIETFINWMKENQTLEFLKPDKIKYLSTKYSFQEWMVNKWVNQLGDEIEQLLIKLNQPAPITLRVNTRKISRDECQARLRDEGIETSKTHLSPLGLIALKRFNTQSLKSFREGLFEVQDEGSQIISLLVNPKPGIFVIDACAGAGGKSLHMADIMNDQGKIIAIDVDSDRLKNLKVRASRANINIIETVLQKNLRGEDLVEKADIVLIDSPCSGVGTIRRNPNLKWTVTEQLIQQYSKKQNDILVFNSSFVKVNGLLVYATCSLFKEENDYVIEKFLNTHTEFQLVPTENNIIVKELNSSTKTITLYPHYYDTDGFFIALLKRIKI